MDKKPLVSILMNCFNGERYLKEAIDSVISQTYQNWELVFWDNQSTDRSLKIISKYKDKRIKVFRSDTFTNLGEARKRAFSKVQGNYLAFLDVDDIWYKDKLKEQLACFRDNKIGISFTNTLFFSKKHKEILYKNEKHEFIGLNNLITNYCLSLESIMLNIEKINQLDYHFDSNYSHISDFDLVIRLAPIVKIKYINQVLSGWRIHDNNESYVNKIKFSVEKEKWCKYQLNNPSMHKYKANIKELLLITKAEKRINNYKIDIQAMREIINHSFINYKNLLFIIFSLIPIIPRIIFRLKEASFKRKWLL